MNDVLKMAIREAIVDEDYKEYQSNVECEHEFSSGFNDKMDRVIEDFNKSRKTGKPMKIKTLRFLLVAVLIGAFGFVMATASKPKEYEDQAFDVVDASQVGNITMPTNDQMIQIKFDIDNSLSFDEFEIKIPKYIPDGYEVVNQMILMGESSIEYGCDDNRIIYTQSLNAKTVYSDVENANEIEEVDYIGGQGYWFHRDAENVFVWSDGTYVYSIIGDLNRDEIMKIIDSIFVEK